MGLNCLVFLGTLIICLSVIACFVVVYCFKCRLKKMEFEHKETLEESELLKNKKMN